jgi:hypothetical protein
LAEFSRVDSCSRRFGSNDADVIIRNPKINADDLEAQKGSDDVLNYGRRNWDASTGFGIELCVEEGYIDTVNMDSGKNARGRRREVRD